MMTTEEQGAASANAAAAASSAEGSSTPKNVPAAEKSESLSAREGQHQEGEETQEAAAASSSPTRTTARAATPTFTSAATPPTTSPSATSPTATGGSAASPMPPLPPPKTPSRISPADDDFSGDLHPMEVHGLRGPLPIIGAGPSRGGGGGGVVGAHHHPFALTPVIRNTSEQELGHHDHHFHGADDGTGGDGHDAARKREQFLNLSVPASMGGKDDDDDDKHRRNSHSGLPAQLMQRPRRPPPQAAVHSAAAAAGPSMLMPASAPPIPPRVSNGGRGGGGPPSLLPAPNHRTAGGAAAASMPFLRMDGGGSGDAGVSAAAAPVLHRPPPAVRSHSAGNLDMHSMVQTIREHLSRQEREGRGLDDGDDEECEDEENIPQWAVEGNNGDDEDAAQARLSEALESDWDVDRCRSLHRRPSPRALRGTAPMSKDPSQELVHQAGLPPPSILHPSLPLHEPEEQRLLAEPYRPNRENSFEVGVKRVDQKELDSIFKPDPRDHSADGSKGSPLPPPGSSSSSAFRGGNGDGGGPPMLRDLGGLQDLGSAAYHEEALRQQHQHQLPQPQGGQILKGSPLRHPNGSSNGGGSNGVHPVVIPPAVQLSDRDWSIPSIRLANRLRGESSLCSFASHEYGEDDDRTEEDNIYCYRNDGDFGEDEDAETLSTAGSLDVSHHRLPALVAVDEEQERPPAARSAESSVSKEGSRRERQTVLIEGGIIADALSSSSAAAPARPREESGSVSQDSGVAAVGGLTASSSAMGDLSVRSDAEAAAAQEEEGGAAGETTSQEPWPQDSQQEPPTSTSLPPPIAASAPIVSAGAEGSSTTSSSSPHRPRRGQRPQRHKPSSSSRESRNKEAIAWLRTVEVGGISEAASSKFLTGGVRAGLATAGAGAAPTAPAAARLKTGGSPGSVLLRPHPMSRVISSPAAACVSQTSS